jgi:hypothetical protein
VVLCIGRFRSAATVELRTEVPAPESTIPDMRVSFRGIARRDVLVLAGFISEK